MEQKKIRTGVIGIGAIGKNHARIMGELENADFTAIYDADKKPEPKPSIPSKSSFPSSTPPLSPHPPSPTARLDSPCSTPASTSSSRNPSPTTPKTPKPSSTSPAKKNSSSRSATSSASTPL
jgi:hypothetical protein